MKRIYILILLAIISFKSNISYCQSDFERSLNKMYDRIIIASDNDKPIINDSIRNLVEGYINSDTIFKNQLSGVRFLGELQSNDKNLKIVNWNVMDSGGDNSYYCYFIKKNRKENSVFKLEGRYSVAGIDSSKVFGADDWYGALYYDVRHFRSNRRDLYMVLGYDYTALGESRKIIDIVGFNDNGIYFGDGVLDMDGATLKRHILKYSSDGVVSLRFHSNKSVVFDHLTAFSNEESSGPSYGSALSFDAFILEKGIWKFYSNVDIRNQK